MESIREYILSVTAAAILCAVLSGIAGKKDSASGIVKLIGGLFLTFTVIRPIAQVSIEDFTFLTDSISVEAQEAVSIGEDYARESQAALIKSQTEAYILDKAKSLSTSVEVCVAINSSGTPVPKEVYITGKVSPYVRSRLEAILSEDLGIAKENQIWIS